MPIRTVFFDMGGTIDTFWCSPEMRLAVTPELQALLSTHRIDLHLNDRQLYELIVSGLARYHQWRLDSLEEIPAWQVWRKYILACFPQDFPQLDAVADDLTMWIETHYYQRQMRPEVPAVLDTIQKMGYKIGMISNVSSLGQVPYNLKQYGIIHYFHPIVLSSEYRRRKPDPAIFHHAARLSSTPTSECVYIGDRISRDVLGAKRAGFKMAIQIRHDFEHGETDEGATPDLILDNMTELLDVLHAEALANNLHREKTSAKNIRAVLFDAEGVLYYRKDKDDEYQRICREFGIKISAFPEEQKEHFRRMASVGLITFDEYKQKVLELIGVSDQEQLSRGIQIAYEESEKVGYFDGARETLEKLKNDHIYLGIVTDTAHPLHAKIDKLERGGIGHLWDTIIASREVGVQKPDPKIYQLALQQIGVQPHEAVFVGHKSKELEGAKKVGMQTVAFNYEASAVADYYISQFTDLAALPAFI